MSRHYRKISDASGKRLNHSKFPVHHHMHLGSYKFEAERESNKRFQ